MWLMSCQMFWASWSQWMLEKLASCTLTSGLWSLLCRSFSKIFKKQYSSQETRLLVSNTRVISFLPSGQNSNLPSRVEKSRIPWWRSQRHCNVSSMLLINWWKERSNSHLIHNHLVHQSSKRRQVLLSLWRNSISQSMESGRRACSQQACQLVGGQTSGSTSILSWYKNPIKQTRSEA